MENAKIALVLDFDGVLIDSADELALAAYGAETGHIAFSFDSLPEGYLNAMRAARPLVQPAGDAVVLARWALNEALPRNIEHLDHHEFLKLREKHPVPSNVRRENLFRARREIVARDKTKWCEMNQPYHPIWEALAIEIATKIYVLTNKNSAAVVDLAEYFGLPLDPNKIFGGDSGRTKAENLQAISKACGTKNMLFVEDSLHNLLEVKRDTNQLQIIPYLAIWGYIAPNDIQSAKSLGFKFGDQNSFLDLAKEIISSSSNTHL